MWQIQVISRLNSGMLEAVPYKQLSSLTSTLLWSSILWV